MAMSQTRISLEWLLSSYGRDHECGQAEAAAGGVLKNFAQFTEKHLRQSLFFNKVAGLSLATLLKKRLWRRCFPVNFVRFLRTPFLHISSVRLLLDRIKCVWQNLRCMCLVLKCRNMFIQDIGIKFLSFSSLFAQAHLLFFLYYNVIYYNVLKNKSMPISACFPTLPNLSSRKSKKRK